MAECRVLRDVGAFPHTGGQRGALAARHELAHAPAVLCHVHDRIRSGGSATGHGAQVRGDDTAVRPARHPPATGTGGDDQGNRKWRHSVTLMARRFGSSPSLQRTRAKRARWYIRPSAPIRKGGKWRSRQLPSIYLGFCDEISEKEAEAKRITLCRALDENIQFTGFPYSVIGRNFIENSGHKQEFGPSLALDEQYDIPAVRRGAIAEWLVAADLLAKGYEVFRPLHQGSSCDLAAYDGTFYRIEVKYSSRDDTGIWLTRNAGKYDVLALVNKVGKISYTAAADVDRATVTIASVLTKAKQKQHKNFASNGDERTCGDE